MKNRLFRHLLVILFTLLVVPGTSLAEVYKWTDEKGQVHYSDQKPPGQEVESVEIKINSYESVSYGTVNVDMDDKPQKAKSKKVVMFSASWCGYCKQARNYFRKNRIPFTEYDIEKSAKGERLYKKLGARGVPVILVGKKRMNGFSEPAFASFYR